MYSVAARSASKRLHTCERRTQELDPNYEPSEAEVEEYAKWLGMQLPEDADLLYIAREGESIGACRPRAGVSSLARPFIALPHETLIWPIQVSKPRYRKIGNRAN